MELLANADTAERLFLSFDSWEGPLDLLLTLARAQKIDLQTIPILPLVDQYIAFIQEARNLRLEVAADHLVMAAWLAYLKSALLLPPEEKPDPDPEELAERLRWRLRRLNAMREAADQLMTRHLLGRDIHLRGCPEGLRTVRAIRHDVDLAELLMTYADLQRRAKPEHWTPHARGPIVTLEEALERLSSLTGHVHDWTALQKFLPASEPPSLARSRLASSFVAALELARLGRVSLRQDGAFQPLLLKSRAQSDTAAS